MINLAGFLFGINLNLSFFKKLFILKKKTTFDWNRFDWVITWDLSGQLKE
jgi:hypothetical protein